MTNTLSSRAQRGTFLSWRLPDLSRPVLIAVTLLLAVMIVLPMGWLVVYSLSDKAGHATLGNFVALFTDPTFVDPLITTLIIAFSVSAICCAVAAPLGWLVARTDMPIRRTVRTLVMASLVTPPFVGAIAWEMLAAPNSGLLNQLWRSLTGMPPDEALLDIYNLPGLIFVIACYTFPYVFILVANALDRMPGELEDASSMLGAGTWDTARRITVPLALPTLLAGALVAFLQALNLFGSPAILAIPAGFHTLTTRIWSLFQFPPKPELAAAASLPLLLLTILLLRGQALALGRRGYAVLGGKYGEPRLVRLGAWRFPAAALALLLLAMPLFLPYAARICREKGLSSAGPLVRRITMLFVVGAVGYWAVLIPFKGPVFRLLYAGRYLEVAHFIPYVALGTTMWAAAFGPAILLRAIESPDSIFYARLVASALSLAVGVPATKWFGLWGVVWSVIIANLAAFLISMYILNRKSKSVSVLNPVLQGEA